MCVLVLNVLYFIGIVQMFVFVLQVLPHTTLTKADWVEIPQITSKPPQLPSGIPSPENKFPVTTPSSYQSVMSTLKPSTPTSPTLETVTSKQREQIKAQKKNTTKEGEFSHSSFLAFLQTVQDTLILNAKKSSKGKVDLLKSLRNNLLTNIFQRMGILWNRPEAVAEARGEHDDHGMEFPSNEGALITIGFLTFAVYLVKLVLKLIHTLKKKENNNYCCMTGRGSTSASTYIGRTKRDFEGDDGLQLLRFIEEYKYT